ncbi:MAG: aspartyl/asparaginyl beta-hydroxylase domain-containing protein [Alphaproteobacteria bacterium]|jgi:aspartate beta-hydroxylase|nr:aspartyl/asparaginyl beta-hydroxylase domain-containing protein [Alphaproteobacteria bacterium]MBU2041929.1 aspartyl/asparaginyl beta-hydroxylase domain-containing protein [Alphaproteobacteria bacterium]MBU2124627.1 aspartyl/asparaginyl beta-hydroxylase domain-containing protein [Alphaproteobacteria bacterium]MBU2207426.1 aspartyl/asparaginyl beta-hydroxylase domain-containing protein [Alphaproteobacteria bacterium]MBU2289758.1 aspartyl/asparaginyl beta-hydroxylase domain-containing protein 
MANREPSLRAAIETADRALAENPRDTRALIAKGDALAGLGDIRAAVSFYSSALRVAGDGKGLAPTVIADLRRAQSEVQAQAQRFEAHLAASLAGAGFDAASSSDRFALSLDLMAGRKRLYQQEPRFYLFPGLPQVQFQPRESLPWLAAVEAATDDIRAELGALLAEPDLFRPYVEPRADRPNRDGMGLASNADWSALFLWKDGEEQPDIAHRCPRTMEALAEVPLCRVPGRTPSILFSKLKAGARIPPHHGLINTRLICHLPLIAPPGSRFRVGNDARDWREGQAWAFDDTIEHEAANDSGEDRTILIFDVWKPEMSEEERALVSALFQAVDAYGAGGQAWGV